MVKILSPFPLFIVLPAGFGVHGAASSLTLQCSSVLISLYNQHLKLEFILFWSLNTSGQFRGTCVRFSSLGLPFLAGCFGFLFVLFCSTRTLYISD